MAVILNKFYIENTGIEFLNSLIEIDAQAFHSGMYFMNVSSPSAFISIPIIKK